MNGDMLPAVIDTGREWDGMPVIGRAGRAAMPALRGTNCFQPNCAIPIRGGLIGHAVRQFLGWCEAHTLELRQITPGWVGTYYDELHASIPTKKQHLSALRCFFDRLVLRHAVGLNPAASVRGERYPLTEGKTPEITVDQEKALLASIRVNDIVGLRDRAIVAVLDLHRRPHRRRGRAHSRELRSGGSQSSLRFLEKGGKVREIPVAIDLAALSDGLPGRRGAASAPADSPLFRRLKRKTQGAEATP